MHRCTAALVFASSMILAQLAEAQVADSRLSGAVTDDQKAGLPGVNVIASNEANASTRTTATSVNGTYAVDGLEPGQYTVTFQLEGFETVERTGVELRPGQESSIDAVLDIAEVVEEIVVTGPEEDQQQHPG